MSENAVVKPEETKSLFMVLVVVRRVTPEGVVLAYCETVDPFTDDSVDSECIGRPDERCFGTFVLEPAAKLVGLGGEEVSPNYTWGNQPDEFGDLWVTMAYPIYLDGECERLYRAIRGLTQAISSRHGLTPQAAAGFLVLASKMKDAEAVFMEIFSNLVREVERIKKTIPPVVRYGQTELQAMAEWAASQ